MTEEPPPIPLEDLLRVARQHTTHRVEAYRDYDDGEPMYVVEIFDLTEVSPRPECRRVSDAILEYCLDQNLLASYAVQPASPRAPQAAGG